MRRKAKKKNASGCPTCGKPARNPYRRVSGGRTVEGCVDKFHTGHLSGKDAQWHNRPEAKQVRSQMSSRNPKGQQNFATEAQLRARIKKLRYQHEKIMEELSRVRYQGQGWDLPGVPSDKKYQKLMANDEDIKREIRFLKEQLVKKRFGIENPKRRGKKNLFGFGRGTPREEVEQRQEREARKLFDSGQHRAARKLRKKSTRKYARQRGIKVEGRLRGAIRGTKAKAAARAHGLVDRIFGANPDSKCKCGHAESDHAQDNRPRHWRDDSHCLKCSCQKFRPKARARGQKNPIPALLATIGEGIGAGASWAAGEKAFSDIERAGRGKTVKRKTKARGKSRRNPDVKMKYSKGMQRWYKDFGPGQGRMYFPKGYKPQSYKRPKKKKSKNPSRPATHCLAKGSARNPRILFYGTRAGMMAMKKKLSREGMRGLRIGHRP